MFPKKLIFPKISV